jgi:hypothetical protein
MRPDESPSRDVREAVERLRQRTLGLGERRGWFAPRPGPEMDEQARREVAELDALYALPGGAERES